MSNLEEGHPPEFRGLLRIPISGTDASQVPLAHFWEALDASSETAILLFDDQFRIYAFNRTALQLYGYSESELVGVNLHDLRAEEPEGHPERRGGLDTYQLEHRRKDGTRFPVEVLSQIVTLGGQSYFIQRVRDISERRRQMREREQAAQALAARAQQQAVVAELGQFALASSDLDTLFDRAVHQVAATLNNEYCKVLELLPGGQSLLLRAGVGWKAGLVGHSTVDAGPDSQSGYTLTSHEPVVVQDLASETRFHGSPLLLDHAVKSGMSVIIQGRARPWGVLGTHSRQGRVFTRDDVNFFLAVANVLAEAIESKRAAQAIQASQDELRAVNAELEVRVRARTAELELANARLKTEIRERTRAQESLRHLAAHLESVREEERTRLARELHDELGQMLTAAKIDVSMLAKDIGRKPSLDQAFSDNMVEALHDLNRLLDDSVDMMRRIVHELRPEALREMGLQAALESLVREFQTRTGISGRFVGSTTMTEPDPNQALGLYRIAQESLTNVARHAQAQTVVVCLLEEDRALVLEVVDDGRGLEPGDTDKDNHFGILGMRERIMQLGGDLQITGAPEKGTRVIARLPRGPAVHPGPAAASSPAPGPSA